MAAKKKTKPEPKKEETKMSNDELGSVVEYSVDIADQEAPKPLPVGEYTATISAAERKLSQRETAYAAVAFVISPDQYPADYDEGNPDGTTIIYRRVSLEDNPQARFGCRRFCEATGAKLGKRIDISEWIGLEATVSVKHTTYEGIERAEIDRVTSA